MVLQFATIHICAICAIIIIIIIIIITTTTTIIMIIIIILKDHMFGKINTS